MTRRFLLIATLAAGSLLGLAGSRAAAQGTAATPPAKPASAAGIARPAWKDLTPQQREALAPLETKWDSYDATRKQKWLEVAGKYPNLAPDGKQRLHERMAEFAQLTPQQRQTLRENFRKAYELPADQRQAVIQQYKDLPPDQRQALSAQAAKKDEPPRRTPRDLPSDRTKAPERKTDAAPASR